MMFSVVLTTHEHDNDLRKQRELPDVQREVLTLDNSVGREFFNKTSFLVGIKIEVKSICNRHNT